MIRTPRLNLILPPPEMAPRVLAYLARNWTRFAGSSAAEVLPAQDTVAAQLAGALAEHEQGRGLRLYIFRSGEAEPIGDISLTEIVRGAFQACYLGYRVDGAHEGQGYIGESVAAVTAYAFDTLNLHRIMANYMPENVRSARVLEHAGFEIEGRARAYLRLGGQWRDHVLTSLTNPQWQAR